VYNFTVESQILYHAPLSFEPSYGAIGVSHADPVATLGDRADDGDDAVEIVKDALGEQTGEAWRIGEEEIKIFVNSERWSLGMFG
jgi:phosphatidylinositol glycan class S